MKILVADDDASIRGLISMILANDGYEIIEAGDSDDAITQVFTHSPDLILLDYRMPEGDCGGLDALIHLRRGGAEQPIIMLTASSEQKVAVQCFREGATDFLQKPLDSEILSLKVRHAIASYRYRVNAAKAASEVFTLYNALLDLRQECDAEVPNPHVQERIDAILRRFSSVKE